MELNNLEVTGNSQGSKLKGLKINGSARKKAPGPKGHFVLGCLPERRRDPLHFFLKTAAEYGDVVQMRFGPRTVVLVNSSEHIKSVLVDKAHCYVKGFGYDKLEELLGKGLLTAEGKAWHKQRKLSQPAFHKQRLAGLTHFITTSTKETLEEFSKASALGKPFDLHQSMMRLTLQVVSRMILGTDINEKDASEVGEAMDSLLESANDRILSLFPIPRAIPTPMNLRSAHYMKVLNDVVFRIIEEHRSSRKENQDLLTMLMDAKDPETGETFSDEELRDQVMTMFLAGHETTANLLTWTFYYLSRMPHLSQGIYDEVLRVAGPTADVEMKHLSALTYTTKVIQESMRLSPPAWILSRECIEAHTIGEFEIAPKTIVLVSPYVTHRKPEYFPNPEGFDPERFSEENIKNRPKYAYIPFSGGARQCIGSGFAMMESQMIMATLIREYQVDLEPGFEVVPEPLITLRPKNGVMVRLRKRDHELHKGGPLAKNVQLEIDVRQSGLSQAPLTSESPSKCPFSGATLSP